jgi:hypothetical protein
MMCGGEKRVCQSQGTHGDAFNPTKVFVSSPKPQHFIVTSPPGISENRYYCIEKWNKGKERVGCITGKFV